MGIYIIFGTVALFATIAVIIAVISRREEEQQVILQDKREKNERIEKFKRWEDKL